MSRSPPQVRINESNRSLDHIRDYGDDNEVSSPIRRLDQDGQGGLQIYSTTINVDIDDDAEEESQVVEERLDIKTIGRILLRIESSIRSIGNRITVLERSRLDDTIQFHLPQRFEEATPIPASVLRSVMFSPSHASVITTAVAPTAQPVPLVASSPTTIESRRVPVAKYIKVTPSSLDIANKYCVSLGDKMFD